MSNCSWKTFDEFRNCAFGSWRVTIVTTDINSIWKKNKCAFPSFFKKYICKHIIGIALRTTPEIRKSIPLAAKNLPLTAKRKTGRPALAKKVW
jgi:hypothetical protein